MGTKEHMDGIAKRISEEALTPYMSFDMESGKERMWKNIFVMGRFIYDREVEVYDGQLGKYVQKTIPVKWGMKSLSKENKDGMIESCFYFGVIDKNDDWHNKHGGGQFKPMTKEEFEKYIKSVASFVDMINKTMMKPDSLAAKDEAFKNGVVFDVQDYSFLHTVEAQIEYMRMSKQGEARKLTPEESKKWKEIDDKIMKEKADGQDRKDNG